MRTLTIMMTVLLAIGCTAGPAAEEATVADTKALAKCNNAFAIDLYDRLRQDEANEGANMFMSPFSISTALAMTYGGAENKTEEQMAETLRLDMEEQQIHSGFRRLLDHLNGLQKQDELQMSVANALWGQDGYGFRDDYLDLTRKSYDAGLQQVDFRANVEAARERINEWVADKTQDKIKNLIPRGALNRMTRLVLTNAIYFKARWANVFREEATSDKPFTLLSGQKTDVPTMHQTDRFGYAETDTVKMLELPYKDHKLSMLIVLPRKDGGLPELEENLSSNLLGKLIDDIRHVRVRVALPKFKLTSKFMLGKTLQAMGMTDAFDPARADFSGMSDRVNKQANLFIQAVVHKAYVDVYEKGTEAAAATGVVVGVTSAPVEPPKVFKADHPFLFLIRDSETGSILFIGRLMDPSK